MEPHYGKEDFASNGARIRDHYTNRQALNPLRYRSSYFVQMRSTKSDLTHCILVNSSTFICWTSLNVILGVSDLFCRFYSIVDGISC